VTTLNTSLARATSERLLLVLAAFLAACASDTDTESPSRETAAVEVVQNKDSQWAPGREWRVGAQPRIEIGSDAREYQFAGVQGAVRLSDGRIVVGDAGSSEVRLYDPQGRFMSAAGRAGGGPEEFRRMGKLVRATGDTVAVFDAATRRLSLLGPGGTFERTVTPAAATLGASFAGVLENGSYVFGVPLPLPPREGLSRDSVVYLLVSPDGTDADTLIVAPGGEQYQRVDGSRVSRMTNPLGPMPAASASGERISVGATDTYEIRQFGPDGTATRVIRREVAPEAFTDAHFRRVADRFPQMATALAEIPRPSQAPMFSSLLLDGEDNLWVQDYPSPGAPAVLWTVFDPRGGMLGRVALPPTFRPTDIGADYVLGVWTDDLDVERIHVYSLEKP
jgi:hypothetical protein